MATTQTAPLSRRAITESDRAARKIAREIEKAGGVDQFDIHEASYEEAMKRNIYQSDAEMERWFDWRTRTEKLASDLLNR